MSIEDARRLRLLTLDEVPSNTVRTYRVAYRAQLIIVCVLAAIVAFCLYLAWIVFSEPSGHRFLGAVALGWMVLWLGLFLVIYGNDLRKALRPTAWLAQVAEEGVYIKLRTYQNTLTEGTQVLYVPFHALRAARELSKTWLRPAERGTSTAKQTCAELILDRAVSLDELSAWLAAERSQALPGNRPPGVRVTWRHYPVSVEPEQIVRVEWRARPSVTDFLEHIAVRVRMADPAESTTDAVHAPDDDALRELARRGDIMTLTSAIHARDQGTLAEAQAAAERMIAEG